jgi:hypothetical protein
VCVGAGSDGWGMLRLVLGTVERQVLVRVANIWWENFSISASTEIYFSVDFVHN